MSRWMGVVGVALLVAGCLGGPGEPAPTQPGAALPAGGPFTFSSPLRLTSDDAHGFEPSIDVGPDGAVYVTAARSPDEAPVGGAASWLWYSSDDGATFATLPSPAGVRDLLPGAEGDTAVDAMGRLYFADTYLADNTLSRWSPAAAGPVWDFTRPVMGTHPLDDRPWLTAHGDGIVYFSGNAITATPALVLPPRLSNYHLYRSDDAGVTWLPVNAMLGGLCNIAASPADDQTLFSACINGATMRAGVSHDRGATMEWSDVAERERGVGQRFLTVAGDDVGNGYFVWIDGNVMAGEETALHIGRLAADGDGTWEALELPYNGTSAFVWVAARGAGEVAVVFYGHAGKETSADSVWYGELLHTPNATAADPVWTLQRFDVEPVRTGPNGNPDFFQAAFGPDGALHIAYGRYVGGSIPGGVSNNFNEIRADVMYVKAARAPAAAP